MYSALTQLCYWWYHIRYNGRLNTNATISTANNTGRTDNNNSKDYIPSTFLDVNLYDIVHG